MKTMKMSMKIFALACAILVWQGCGSKSGEAVIEAQKKEANALAKHERLAKERAEREEQRRLAILEKAKDTPSYTDAMGKIIYYKAEIDPAFPGGDAAMMKYLSDNIIYPQVSQDNGTEGTAFIDFVVDEEGTVTEVTMADFVGDDDQLLKEEAIRVVKSMPKWLAGTQHGKTVAVTFSIPITFELN